MFRSKDKDGLIFTCSLDGNLLEVICDADAIQLKSHIGEKLYELADGSSKDKCAHFLDTVRANRAAYDWELYLGISHPQLFSFSGFIQGDILVIMASAAIGHLHQLHDELILINNEQLNTIRSLKKELALKENHTDELRQKNYERIERLNQQIRALEEELASLRA